ncbi:MAG TPA: nickel-binding protein [Candidatus Limnocylindrales bacterium]|nr:nickel-binding protein [Candidatus Limnocylindrales bacterium]
MPFYMDRHEFTGLTATEAANMHLRDMALQDRFGVQLLTYWFDYDRQTAFCLADAPSADDVSALHAASHGGIPTQVIEVDERVVERFMGGITAHQLGEPYVETAFRTILFTDLESSTTLTQTMGDARAMALLRRHDEIIRDAVQRHGGSEVKHTGDGLMAAFPSVSGGIDSAVQIQRRFAGEDAAEFPLRIRIGMAAGEPVTEHRDFFGAAVQLAARLVDRAAPGTVLVSSTVHDLALGKGFEFLKRGRIRPKGFADSVQVYEVVWQEAARPAASSESR